jgi:hypothetical protein
MIKRPIVSGLIHIPEVRVDYGKVVHTQHGRELFFSRRPSSHAEGEGRDRRYTLGRGGIRRQRGGSVGRHCWLSGKGEGKSKLMGKTQHAHPVKYRVQTLNPNTAPRTAAVQPLPSRFSPIRTAAVQPLPSRFSPQNSRSTVPSITFQPPPNIALATISTNLVDPRPCRIF